jgi:hypothetical protein
VLSFVALFVLVGADVTGPTVEADRTDCGSPFEVLRRGSGFGGGEIRVDEERFDVACVQRARTRIELAAASGVVLVGVLGVGAVLSSRERRHRRSDLLPNYPVPR